MNKKKIVLLSLTIFVLILFLVPAQTTTDYQTDPVSADLNIEDSNLLSADGDGWLSGYRYRTELNFYEFVGAGTNYQRSIHVEYNGAIGAQNAVDCNAHCQTDFGDIRFTDGDGSTELDYWIEEKTNSDDATFWVEVRDDLSYSANIVIIWIYYGTSGTSSTTSNGDNTFLAFFDNGDTSGWTTSGISVSTSGDYLRFYNPNAAAGGMASRAITTNDGFMFMARYKTVSLGTNDRASIGLYDGTTANRFALAMTPYHTAQSNWYYYDGAMKSGGGWTEGTESIFTISVDEGNSATGVDYRRYNTAWTLQDSAINENFASGSPTDCDNLYLGDTTTAAKVDAYYRWIIIRNWQAAEPYIITAGNTEEDTKPTITANPTCTNPDNTDNLYAQYDTYLFTTTVSDFMGYADIKEVYLKMYDTGETTLRWSIKYTESTSSFSEYSGTNLIELVTGSCVNTKTGNNIYLTFALKIEFAVSDLFDEDLAVECEDDSSIEATHATTNANLNLRRVLYLSSEALNDGSGTADRGNYNSIGTITASGYVKYSDSTNVLTGSVDAFVTCSDVAGSPWSDTTFVFGGFSMGVDSDDIVGLDSYKFVIVEEGGSATDTNLLDKIYSKNYIADRAKVITYLIAQDDRINIGQTSVSAVQIYYEYDNQNLNDGTVTVNGLSASYVPIRWYFGETKNTVQSVTYNNVQVSGNEHGITTTNQNGQSWLQVWDSLTITMHGPTDNRISIGSSASGIYATAIYDYDSTAFDGTLTLNDTTMNHGTVGIYYYTVASASGDTHGITTISTNDNTWCIFDSVTITVTDPTDSRINIGSSVSGISASGVYDYDGAVFDGSIVLNDTTLNYGTVGIRYYTASSLSGDTYGITAIGSSNSVWCIWDSLTISIIVNDNRININVNASITVSATYTYDSTPFGGSLILNYTTYEHSTAQKRGYTVTSVSGGTHGISVIGNNDVDYVIWDSYTVSITVTDHRININSNATGIYVSVISDYDGFSYDGTVNLNYSTWTQTTAQRQGFTVVSLAGDDTHGITAISTNDADYVIWDSLIITISVSDNRININDNGSICVSAVYAYDGSIFDGTLTLNYTTYEHSTAQKRGYTVSSASGDSYGITTISTNDADYMIWDSLTITITGPNDQNIDVGTNATGICVSAIYDYDSSVFDGTLTLNDTTFLYYTAGKRGYTVSSASGDSYGISVINVNDDTWCIWGSVTITLTINYQWTIQGLNVTIYYSGIYAHDSSNFEGTIILDSGTFYPSNTATGNYTFTTISISDPLYGLTSFDSNIVWCIWDNIDFSASYYWTQYSPTEVWLLYHVGLVSWAENGTNVDSSPQVILQSYINGTLDDWGIVADNGYIGDMVIGRFTPDWHNANITITAICGGHEWVVWQRTLNVEILHSIHVIGFSWDYDDTYITCQTLTEWGNATFSVFMNGSIVGHSGVEGGYQIVKPTTTGTYNYVILINATHGSWSTDGQYADFSSSDYWVFYNRTFVVNPVILSLTDFFIIQDETIVQLSGYLTTNATLTIVEKGMTVYTATVSGYFSVYWIKDNSTSSVDWVATFTDGTTTIIRTGTYSEATLLQTILDLLLGFDFKQAGISFPPILDIIFSLIALVVVGIILGGIAVFSQEEKDRKADRRATKAQRG